ncbi:hypothetical protein ACHAWF_016573 [Thalassiosira exigua]
MTIAGSREERAEVRARAALALCDLALIHERLLAASPEEEERITEDGEGEGRGVPSVPFKDMLLEMLGHKMPWIVIVAAEIAAKLLLAGRLRDPHLVAMLVLEDEFDVDGAAAKEVGSPVRLQQLLSIFFPTYSMSSLDANDDLMACVGPLLSEVQARLSGKRARRMGKEALERWPVAKMIEYVCYNVDLADKKKNEEADKKASTVVEEPGGDSQEDPVAEKGLEVTEDPKIVGNNVEDGDDVIEASSTLLASIDVAEFLSSEEGEDAPTYYLRALAKVLGSARIDVGAEDATLLRRLKALVSEAEHSNDDGVTVRSVRKLADRLVDVEDEEDEGGSVSTEGSAQDDAADNDEEVMENGLAEKEEDSLEKENPRTSLGSVKSTKLDVDGGRRSSSHRASLADVNCN